MKGFKAMLTIGIIVALLVGFSFPASGAWEKGQMKAYKWVGDWQEITKKQISAGDRSSTWSGEASGKSVNAYMVKYMGRDNIGYKFHYDGGFYTYGYLNGEEKTNTSDVKGTIKIKAIWIDYAGDFHLVMVNGTDGSYYGVKDFSFHVYTKEPFDIYVSMSMKSTEKTQTMFGGMSISMKLSGTFDISVTSNYSEPIPYIPVSSNFNRVTVFSTASYSGHINAKTSGYYVMSGKYGGKTLSVQNSLNKTINKGFNGENNISAVLEKTANRIKYPALISGLSIRVLEGAMVNPLSSSVSEEWNPDKIAYPSEVHYANATMGSDGFYTSVEIPSAHPLYPNPTATNPSQETTPEDVRAVETGAPQNYGEYSEPNNLLSNTTMIIIIVVVIVAVIAVVVVMMKKKKRPPQAPADTTETTTAEENLPPS